MLVNNVLAFMLLHCRALLTLDRFSVFVFNFLRKQRKAALQHPVVYRRTSKRKGNTCDCLERQVLLDW